MVENVLRQTSKKTWYRWSLYINLILFFIVAIFIYLLIKDSIDVGINKITEDKGDVWLYAEPETFACGGFSNAGTRIFADRISRKGSKW